MADANRVARQAQIRDEAKTTEGRTLLNARLDSDESWNASKLAAELGLSQPTVSEWRRGNSRPDVPWRLRLEMLLGIPAAAWLTETERAIIAAGAPASTPAIPSDDAPDAA